MTKCDFCGRVIEKIRRTKSMFVQTDIMIKPRVIEGGGYDLPFHCNYCGGTFCSDHRLPEKHNCLYDFGAAKLSRQTLSPVSSHEANMIMRGFRNVDKIKKIDKKFDGIHDHDGTKVIHDDDGGLWIHGRRHSRIEVIENKPSNRDAQEKLDYMKDFEYIGEKTKTPNSIKEEEHDIIYAANIPKGPNVLKILLLIGLGLIGIFYILYPARFHEIFNNLIHTVFLSLVLSGK